MAAFHGNASRSDSEVAKAETEASEEATARARGKSRQVFMSVPCLWLLVAIVGNERFENVAPLHRLF
ncbi:hypothetical protein VVCECT4999_16220 [Vibrio vulnificus]|nr:hypothetical protein VVCECT4999_16220 [Vibrio vulnificus]KGK70891.1 hypothetical protein NA76_07935 [Vibrio vulnificus]PNG78138.1 hypothetical protein TI31_00505 [Vibrio vulnificus]